MEDLTRNVALIIAFLALFLGASLIAGPSVGEPPVPARRLMFNPQAHASAAQIENCTKEVSHVLSQAEDC